jgi:hypothetical protein
MGKHGDSANIPFTISGMSDSAITTALAPLPCSSPRKLASVLNNPLSQPEIEMQKSTEHYPLMAIDDEFGRGASLLGSAGKRGFREESRLCDSGYHIRLRHPIFEMALAFKHSTTRHLYI